MSDNGKRISVYAGDPIQQVKQSLRDQNSLMTLSARLNRITQRYLDFVANGPLPEFTLRDREEIKRNLAGLDITPTAIRGLDSYIRNDRLADRVEALSHVERITLLESLGL